MTTVDFTKSAVAKPRGPTAAASRRRKAAPSSKATPKKADIVVKLLARPKGATIAEVSDVTGWQPHSVRAFFTGLRKKGSVLERDTRKGGTSSYRLMPKAAKPTTMACANVALVAEDGTASAGSESA